MNMCPRVLMDNEGFYLNPEYLVPGEGYTMNDVRKDRVPVRIVSNGFLIKIGDKFTDGVKKMLGISLS